MKAYTKLTMEECQQKARSFCPPIAKRKTIRYEKMLQEDGMHIQIKPEFPLRTGMALVGYRYLSCRFRPVESGCELILRYHFPTRDWLYLVYTSFPALLMALWCFSDPKALLFLLLLSAFGIGLFYRIPLFDRHTERDLTKAVLASFECRKES